MKALKGIFLALVVAGCLVYGHSLDDQIQQQQRVCAQLESEKKDLQQSLGGYEREVASIRDILGQKELSTKLSRPARRQHKFLGSLRGVPISALELDDCGFYLESSAAEMLRKRLSHQPAIHKLSFESGRLAGLWR